MPVFDWKHYAMLACAVGSLVCTVLTQYQQAGHALPFAISAATLSAATAVFGLLTKSLSQLKLEKLAKEVKT